MTNPVRYLIVDAVDENDDPIGDHIIAILPTDASEEDVELAINNSDVAQAYFEDESIFELRLDFRVTKILEEMK